MRTIFLAFLAVAFSMTQLCGQSSPASTEPSKPAAPSGSLTKEERDRAVDYLKQTQKEFLAAIEGLSDAQWKFKSAPDRWSIAEVAEHIAVTEDTIWQLVSGKIMKSPAAPENARKRRGKMRPF
jgi:hypothetical protein